MRVELDHAVRRHPRADEIAKVVSTLDSETIEAKHELGLAEALRGTPGVRVQQQGSPGALTAVRLRGQRNFDTALLLGAALLLTFAVSCVIFWAVPKGHMPWRDVWPVLLILLGVFVIIRTMSRRT